MAATYALRGMEARPARALCALGMVVTPAQDVPLDLSTSQATASSVSIDTAAPASTYLVRRIASMTPGPGPGAPGRLLLHCQFCYKTFDRPSLLKRHLRTHTGERPHVCSVCGKAFSTSSSLNTHSRIHSGEKPHQCQFCGKKFTASSNLYYHRMTHSKDKPHKCLKCPKSFPTPGDLRAHSYIHTGEWPYRCNVCGKGFCKQASFRHHLLIHSQ